MAIQQYKEFLTGLNKEDLQLELEAVNKINNSKDEVKYKTSLILDLIKS